MGYLFAFLAMLSFGMLGILSKLSDRRNCQPLMTTVFLFAASTVMTGAAVVWGREADFAAPPLVVGVALAFGIITMLSTWVFLYGIRFGKITTSWVIINLSAAVPAILSTVVYGEKLGARKLVILLLVAGAILLLWKDMRDERGAAKAAGSDLKEENKGVV
ncbi:MAG: EamA family transporter [Acidobacteriota bacterium]